MTIDVFKRLQEYVGREYRVDYNCAHLVRDVQADLFGRAISLPGAMPAGIAGQRRVINEMRDELAVEIAVPFPGCAVLLTERTADGGELLHIGTAVVRYGEVHVLHNSAKLGSAHFQTLAELESYGMQLVGYYGWK